MSKLPNAPLQEVIFELRWNISNKEDLNRFQFLMGDLYSSLKDKYPFRQSLFPPEFPLDVLIHHPTYRFRHKENDYPLFQVGPGILSLNTNDAKYYWEDFYEWTEELLTVFLAANNQVDSYSTSIIFLDFFKIDFEKTDVLEFINNNFNLKFSQSFYETTKFPNYINLGLQYETEFGNLNISLNNGKQDVEDGLVLNTKITGFNKNPEKEEIMIWLKNSKALCSKLFKKLTEGDLYNSFN
ncbi:MAG: TIGR04255 family protein [Bacteroidota bacterium]|nr:TIGR04255 family protein [Bacteroidota bacterium]